MSRAYCVGILFFLLVLVIFLFVPICWTAGVYTDFPYRFVDWVLHRPDDEVHAENLMLFNSVAKEVGLDFWVSEGSALGLIRSGELITGDSDVDVGVYAKDVDHLKQTIEILLSRHGFRVWRNSPLSIGRSGAYIDIDITDYGQSCMAVEWPALCDDHMGFLEPFQSIKYRNDDYKVPSIEYLVYLYGKDWETPIAGFKPNMVDRS